MQRKGFTLIELLVVIAIIAVLAAILFPVFGAAKDKARDSACTSNMKQIGTALMMYSSDNGAWPCAEALHNQYPQDDYIRLGCYQYGGVAKTIQKYIKNYYVFWCPSDPNKNRPFKPGASQYDVDRTWTSVMFRWCLMMYTYSGNNGAPATLRDSDFVRPGRQIAFHEIWGAHHGMLLCWQGRPPKGQPKLLSTYADGHVSVWAVPYKGGDTPYDANWFTAGQYLKDWQNPRISWDRQGNEKP